MWVFRAGFRIGEDTAEVKAVSWHPLAALSIFYIIGFIPYGAYIKGLSELGWVLSFYLS